MDRRSTATLICDGRGSQELPPYTGRLSRSVIGLAGPPGGGSLPNRCSSHAVPEQGIPARRLSCSARRAVRRRRQMWRQKSPFSTQSGQELGPANPLAPHRDGPAGVAAGVSVPFDRPASSLPVSLEVIVGARRGVYAPVCHCRRLLTAGHGLARCSPRVPQRSWVWL